MSRPTEESRFAEAERWMVSTFGSRMADYIDEKRREPLSVSLSEIDRVLKASGARRLLTQWREEDVRSSAGRKSYIDAGAALGLLLLQVRLRRPTLLTEITETVLEMSPRQRQVLGVRHDGQNSKLYERIWNAVQRLIALVDEFPGRHDKILTSSEYTEVFNARDPEDNAKRRERLSQLSNALVEGTWKMLPADVRSKYDGNVAQDATLVPLLGKLGNPAARNLSENRRTINHDAGFYGRAGAHGAMTGSDAKHLNAQDPKGKYKGTSSIKRTWGVEAEIARMLPNIGGGLDEFPGLTLGVGFHIPGAVAGEGHRMLKSLHDRGHTLNYVAVDRAYPGGKVFEFQIEAQRLGAKLVFDYKDKELGVQQSDMRGFVQISGAWYLNNIPNVLRGMADTEFREARAAFDSAQVALKKTVGLTAADKEKAFRAAARVFAQADDHYLKQLKRRALYLLKRKGKMEQNGTRRYLIPVDAPKYDEWKLKPKAHQGITVEMKLPVRDDNGTEKNPGGLKFEQYLQFGSTEWRKVYGQRNLVESANRSLKRSQFENLADPDLRHVRGNTFTYLAIAVAAVVENLRNMVTFFKKKLAIVSFNSKNRRLAETFWQSSGLPPVPTEPPPPN